MWRVTHVRRVECLKLQIPSLKGNRTHDSFPSSLAVDPTRTASHGRPRLCVSGCRIKFTRTKTGPVGRGPHRLFGGCETRAFAADRDRLAVHDCIFLAPP